MEVQGANLSAGTRPLWICEWFRFVLWVGDPSSSESSRRRKGENSRVSAFAAPSGCPVVKTVCVAKWVQTKRGA